MLTTTLLQVNLAADTAKNAAEKAGEVIPKEETISVLELLSKGGWYIMGPLALLSIIAVYIIIERLIAINKASKEDSSFMDQIRDFIHEGKIDSAKSLCQGTANPIARMIEKGVSRIGKPLNDISAAIENVGKLEVAKLEKRMAALATIAGAAPMIGFLGTVIGMIRTFHDMYTSGNEVEIANLAGGIMQAMVTTATGLVIGIIAYIGYNVLVSKVEKVIYKMEARTIEFLDVLNEPTK